MCPPVVSQLITIVRFLLGEKTQVVGQSERFGSSSDTDAVKRVERMAFTLVFV